MSIMERLIKKKYMGVCSLGLILTTIISSKFTDNVILYVTRNTMKKIAWRYRTLDNPRRMNLSGNVWLASYITFSKKNNEVNNSNKMYLYFYFL